MRVVGFIPSALIATATAACLLVAVPAAAQDPSSALTAVAVLARAAETPRLATLADATAHLPHPQPSLPARTADLSRPAALIPLYGSLAVLQGLDIHSTRRALQSAGTREANPALRPLVKHGAVFIGVKVGATAGVIWASEKMWKKNRKAAVVFAGLVNVALACVVANNYRVGR